MFKGDPNLRSANEQVPMTVEQQQEWIRCANDILYFADNYFKIVTLDGGIQFFKPYPYQRKTIKAILEEREITKHTIVMWPRQQGKCCHIDTKIKIRNKKTKEIEELTIGEFYSRAKLNKNKEINN